ncbi:hypothetical protein CR513_00565, partial [Mucuna pruriens]
MAKVSLLLACLIVLFLIAYGTGFANAATKCESDEDCENLHCFGIRCIMECIDGVCGCNCRPPSENV